MGCTPPSLISQPSPPPPTSSLWTSPWTPRWRPMSLPPLSPMLMRWRRTTSTTAKRKWTSATPMSTTTAPMRMSTRSAAALRGSWRRRRRYLMSVVCFFTIVGSDYAAFVGGFFYRLFVHIHKVPSRSFLGSSSVYFMRVARGGRSALLSSSEDRKLNHLSVAQLRSRIGPETAEIQPLCRNLLYQLVVIAKWQTGSKARCSKSNITGQASQ
mmetsp:Transcript_28321/g.45371  ORF Transcript_28321/g.45371 Transcript_28321/m.45371 type:complete len:212 (-) Transcript_28321:218-853(-)